MGPQAKLNGPNRVKIVRAGSPCTSEPVLGSSTQGFQAEAGPNLAPNLTHRTSWISGFRAHPRPGSTHFMRSRSTLLQAPAPACSRRLPEVWPAAQLQPATLHSADLKTAPNIFKDPVRKVRFRAGFGPKSGPNQAQNIRHNTHKADTNDSDQFLPDVVVFRRRSESF